jgi:hypothetical protein
MSIGLRGYVGAATLIASSTLLPAAATAQEVDVVVPVEVISVDQAFEEEFFEASGTYFRNRSIFEQADTILGFGVPAAFPELEIEADAADIHELYVDLLALQVGSDPILRVPDLPNPYCTSLLLLPGYTTGCAPRTIDTTGELRPERRPAEPPTPVPALF